MERDKIIKAFECCHTLSSDCLSCPFVEDNKSCASISLMALDLIKELAEENEMLKVNITAESLKMVTTVLNYFKSLIEVNGDGTYNLPIITYELLRKAENEILGGHSDPKGDEGESGLSDRVVKETLGEE